MTPEQVRIQFVFIKLAHIDEGYFCLNNSSGYLTCDILSFFTLFLYLNQPKMMDIKCKLNNQGFLHFFINKKYFDRFNCYVVVFSMCSNYIKIRSKNLFQVFQVRDTLFPWASLLIYFRVCLLATLRSVTSFFCTFKYLMSKALAANQTFVLDPKFDTTYTRTWFVMKSNI